MNAIEVLSSQAWVERLGWILIHFVWQGLLIVSLYAVARQLLWRAASPNARYLLACAALTAMAAAPLITWAQMQPSEVPVLNDAYRIHSTPPESSAIAMTLPASVRAAVSDVQPIAFLPWVVMIWFAGATVFWLRLAGGWAGATRMRSRMARPAPEEWQRRILDLSTRVGLSRPVRLLVSGMAQVPAVISWLRPVILIPAGALGGLPSEQVEALLMHELAHIRRHDYLANLLQSIVEALLFYHPAVWWVSGHIRAERELCCDDVAVRIGGDAFVYAQALLELESSRPVQEAVAANGGSLAGRIARLLGQPRPDTRTSVGTLALLSALLLITAWGLFGQSDSHPAFQVASIKRNTAEHPRGMLIRPQPGGRLISENSPLLLLIQNAYSVQAFQMVGGPAWVNSDGYDIEAKPEKETSRKEMWLMVQTLLADRFKLALHRETRELPAYLLTATKGGLKQSPPKEGNCSTPDTAAPPPPPGQAPPCGSPRISMTSTGLHMEGGKVPMTELVRMLAMVLDRPVVDKTGITGTIDIDMTFTPDETTAGLPGSGGSRDPGGPRLPTDPSRPGILAALQEQLGLKLNSGKGPVEVLVIDHVERPTEN